MLNKSDFNLTRIDKDFEDYWFSVSGDSAAYLTDKYMEQSMVTVSEVVYSKREDKLGIKRLFPFNYDVITPSDEELRAIVTGLINGGNHE